MLSLLTLLPGSENSANILRSVTIIQQALEAELLVACPAVETPVYAAEAVATMVVDENATQQSVTLAKQAFDTVCGNKSLARFKDTNVSAYETLRKQTLFVDFFVLGRSHVAADTDTWLLKEALVSNQTPTLLLPHETLKASPSTVVLSWNGQSPTARAIRAALPFAKRAKRVVVLEHTGNEVNRSRLEHFLRLHGVKPADWRTYGDPSLTARARARALLAEAQLQGTDLLAMGAYGDRDGGFFGFGRATDKVASAAKMPVLFSS